MSTLHGKHHSDSTKADTQTAASQHGDFQKLPTANNTLAAGVNHAMPSGSHAAHPKIDHLNHQAHDTVERLSHAAERGVDQLEHGAERIEQQAQQLSATGQHWADSIGENIRSHPVATLGVAVMSGAILSWLLRSRG
jgi:ElaB/YqjD/DUF883 family membrane-anchored ribosome-binding protein